MISLTIRQNYLVCATKNDRVNLERVIRQLGELNVVISLKLPARLLDECGKL